VKWDDPLTGLRELSSEKTPLAAFFFISPVEETRRLQEVQPVQFIPFVVARVIRSFLPSKLL
jgi:hypothetical protein